MSGEKVPGSEVGARYFDATYAERYDEWGRNPFLAYLERRQKRCVSLLSSAGGKSRVLDVGCGVGKYLELLARRSGLVVGADISPDMLARARERLRRAGLRNVHLVRCDAIMLPFRPGSFDELISVNTVQYLRDDLAALRSFAEVARDGGALILDGLCLTELRLGYGLVWLRNRIRRWLRRPPFGPYNNYYTHRGFAERAREAGLRPVRLLGCGIDLPYISKDHVGITLPSPHHIFSRLFPAGYAKLERLDEWAKERPPFSFLGTHIFMRAEVRKGAVEERVYG